MTHACSLEKSSFSLNLVREAATDALRRVLGSLNLGDIELFVEPRLLSLFHHAISLSGEDLTVLRVREIHSLASPSAPPMPTSTVVYIVRPQTTHVQLVAQHLLQQLRGASSSSSVVLHTGTWNALCADVLSRAGVGNQVAVHPFQLGFIPTDNDMLTLDHDTLLRDCYIQNNKTTLTYIYIPSLEYAPHNRAIRELGHALHVLQQTTGDIPTVHYKGELAKAVWKSLSEFNAASPPPSSRPKKLRIDHMIILDRKLDYIAPLSTPLTYKSQKTKAWFHAFVFF
ncbi:hypothetical protein DYB30_002037 [Aphanomyces astaci]|uniref:Uncharacterized protein n=1 Tax=Aphanomyces astaci TaxID=112090 RepID=A0A397D1H5_APHAT|nr:hypothetical protein DYB34_005797 [Aphanomyces astaci]RHY57108.1 hypothetical protein DYB30_002037 [Aphanomyces astaci]RHY59788.1 hypothetical protein DYB38_000848 [Aphanomyces astaci]RHZ00252.1 hypothetical protein DYB26_011880 [Aphanomyces astaci]RHZ27179.1 hypothetical protein DYB31_009854 [Aphanomyces astaci]